jgi:predicted Zn-dependent protease
VAAAGGRARQRGDIDARTGNQLRLGTLLVRDRSVNAFALPGGYVGVHLGLIAMTATRDELASVLAHELSHVTQRHIARGVAAGQAVRCWAWRPCCWACWRPAEAQQPTRRQAAVMGGQAAADPGQLNFSRDMEREADRIGSRPRRASMPCPAATARRPARHSTTF